MKNSDVLFAVGFLLVAGAVLGLAWITGAISLTPPVPDRPPVESLDKLPQPLVIDVRGIPPVSFEEKR